MSSFKSVDKGYEKFKRTTRALKGKSVKIGLLDGSKDKRADGELTNAELGIIHEYGTENIPARPFIAPPVDKHRAQYIAQATSILRGQKTPDAAKALGIVGAKAAADIKAYVTQGTEIPPPNAESTLKRKLAKTRKGKRPAQGPRTLVDTGRMIASVTWKVEK